MSHPRRNNLSESRGVSHSSCFFVFFFHIFFFESMRFSFVHYCALQIGVTDPGGGGLSEKGFSLSHRGLLGHLTSNLSLPEQTNKDTRTGLEERKPGGHEEANPPPLPGRSLRTHSIPSNWGPSISDRQTGRQDLQDTGVESYSSHVVSGRQERENHGLRKEAILGQVELYRHAGWG
jgi:hypothetical protein